MLLGKPAGLRWGALLPGLLLTPLGLGLMMQAVQGSGLAPDAPLAGEPYFWRGVAVAVLAMLLWTAFGLLNAAWLKKHPQVNAATWANWLGVATGLGALVLWLTVGTRAKVLMDQPDFALAAMLCIATGMGCAWLATILWNSASQRLSASLCGQLIVSETLFALLYSFVWDGHWPSLLQALACVLFGAGIFASIRAHR